MLPTVCNQRRGRAFLVCYLWDNSLWSCLPTQHTVILPGKKQFLQNSTQVWVAEIMFVISSSNVRLQTVLIIVAREAGALSLRLFKINLISIYPPESLWRATFNHGGVRRGREARDLGMKGSCASWKGEGAACESGKVLFWSEVIHVIGVYGYPFSCEFRH